MFKIGDIITTDNYVDAANWCNTHPEEKATISKVDGQYVIAAIPEPTEEEKAEKKRAERNRLLDATDKYMISDFPITDEEREKYKAYRAYLRDLPASDLFPNVDVLTFDQWND